MTERGRVAPHAFAAIIPSAGGRDFHALVDDIRRNGLREPITLYEDKILDGRARYRACLQVRVTPTFRKYEGDDPLGFVISANLVRRHLNESQRAMIAAAIETLRHGGDRRSSDQPAKLHLGREEAAQLLSVSPRSVAYAAIVRDQGIPRLQESVLQGKIAVSSAARFAQQQGCAQQQWVENHVEISRAVRAFRRQQTPQGPYVDLLAAEAAIVKLSRNSVATIVAAVPIDKRRLMTMAAGRFKDFFVSLDAEMNRQTREEEHDGKGDDYTQLMALIAKAKKSYGRLDSNRILQEVIPRLNAVQLGILRTGKLGGAAKIAAERAGERVK